MAATARVILMVDPEEKARWTVEASKAGISTAEFLRRAAADGVAPALSAKDDGLIRLAVEQISSSLRNMIATLDAVLDKPPPVIDAEHEAKIRAEVIAEFGGRLPRVTWFERAEDLAA